MPLHVRFKNDVAILGGLARLLSDPRHFDASREVRNLLDSGTLHFVVDLQGVNSMGATLLGLLTTLTRLIRQADGEVVLVGISRSMEKDLEAMRMDGYWDLLGNLDQGVNFWHANLSDLSPTQDFS